MIVAGRLRGSRCKNGYCQAEGWVPPEERLSSGGLPEVAKTCRGEEHRLAIPGALPGGSAAGRRVRGSQVRP